jgi:sugar O-acyltransferase (sialic acid O-acetyltransferase NeuD family)
MGMSGRIRRAEVAVVPAEWDVADLVESIPELRLVGFFDPDPACHTAEFLRLGADEDWPEVRKRHPDLKILIMIDPPQLRGRLFDNYGIDNVLTVFSPHAHVSPRITHGPGLVVQRGAVVMPQVHMGTGCTINLGATIHHECRLGDFVSLAPGSRLLGSVTVGDYAYVGSGAVVLPNVRIGAHAKIGAGAVVNRDIPDGCVAVGVPAKPLPSK